MRYEARVVPGRGKGRRIGFPTVNLAIPVSFPYPHGIYAGFAWMDERRYAAAFHFGPIPTFSEETPSLEAHLIDAVIENVPEAVTFEFVAFLREIRRFPTAKELVAQIAEDVKNVRRTLQV